MERPNVAREARGLAGWLGLSRVPAWLIRPLPERYVLILLVLVGASMWSFVEIADEVMEGDARQMDRALLLFFRNEADLSDPIGPLWLEEMMRDFTGLGGVGVLTLLTAAAVGYILLIGKTRAAVGVILSIGGGILLSSLLKYGFDRPRPDLVPHGSHVYTASFPSGHSMMSAVVYLTLGALVARVRPGVRLKIYVISLAVVLALLIGLSRVYLGVHWPTDVLAGWTMGAAWALLSWTVMLWLQRKGAVEDDLAGQRPMEGPPGGAP